MNLSMEKIRQLTTLERIDVLVGKLLPLRHGLELMELAERFGGVSLCPTMEEFMEMTEAEYQADVALRRAAWESMPCFWREVYRLGMNIGSVENNLDDLRRLEYWRRVYLPCPSLLARLLLETACLAVFGNIYGPAWTAYLLRLVGRGKDD